MSAMPSVITGPFMGWSFITCEGGPAVLVRGSLSRNW